MVPASTLRGIDPKGVQKLSSSVAFLFFIAPTFAKSRSRVGDFQSYMHVDCVLFHLFCVNHTLDGHVKIVQRARLHWRFPGPDDIKPLARVPRVQIWLSDSSSEYSSRPVTSIQMVESRCKHRLQLYTCSFMLRVAVVVCGGHKTVLTACDEQTSTLK